MVNFLGKLSVAKSLHRVGLHVSAIYQLFDTPKNRMISETYHHSFR
jgi:hypothetical protein